MSRIPTKMPDLLLEIRSGELPVDFVPALSRALGAKIYDGLVDCGLRPAEVTTAATSRRVIVVCRGIPRRSFQSEAYLDLDVDEELAGKLARSLVPEVIATSVRAVSTECGRQRWPRPVTGVLAILGATPLVLRIDGCKATRSTVGHAVHSPSAFSVKSFAQYRDELEHRGLEISFDRRRRQLESSLREAASASGGTLVEDDDLVGRLAAGCEMTSVISGEIDPRFLRLPTELVRIAMREGLGVFAVNKDGKLAAEFVAAIERPDDSNGSIRAGFERRLRCELLDMSFRLERDRRMPLSARAEDLAQLEFHPGLGTYGDKTRRMHELAHLVCEQLGYTDLIDEVTEAVRFSKADLCSDLVRDYPESKGIVGGIYAREEGVGPTVHRAISDQYSPRATDDRIPSDRAGQIVAIADRLDSLIGLVGLDESVLVTEREPSSLADGLLRIVLESELELDLDLVVARASLLYGELLSAPAQAQVRKLLRFLAERMCSVLGRRGYGSDEIESVIAVGWKSLPDTLLRVSALSGLRGRAELRSLVDRAKRIFEMVKDSPEYLFDPELASGKAELGLATSLDEVRQRVDGAVAKREYHEALLVMVELVPALDRFFADVLIMDENEIWRANRIALLQACRRIFWRVGRLTLLTDRSAEG